ncbi:unnamed protein product [Soboliphyme baturini]|uniref:Phosphoinositide phospholipase C n=1 Tax=Soboliphyme baturini TaxID=241478 RepID=A0A183J3U0_9BILA|nr:unnamed protein product [Soboliphyme baturini]
MSMDLSDSALSWRSPGRELNQLQSRSGEGDDLSWTGADAHEKLNVSSPPWWSSQDEFQQTLSQLRRTRSCSPKISQSFHSCPESLQRYLDESSASARREKDQNSSFSSLWRFALSAASTSWSPANSLNSPSFKSAVSTSFTVDEGYGGVDSRRGSMPFDTLSGSPLSVSGSKYRPAVSSSFESDSSTMYSKILHGTVTRVKSVRPVVWTKFQLNAERLDIYAQNLRFWISKTILKPLVAEIDNVDIKLKDLSRSNLTLGECTLSDLQHLSTRADISASICLLWPYLELCVHQSYLVARLRQLAADSCISCFKWDSSSVPRGKAWDEHLPTDTEVVFHCFCTYMNTRLPPNPLYLDGKAFTDRYVVRFGNKPQMNRSFPVLYQSSLNPPHFVLLFNGEQYDVGKGKYNMFLTLILFLQILKIKSNGFLGSVSLHSSRLNILWVLDDA